MPDKRRAHLSRHTQSQTKIGPHEEREERNLVREGRVRRRPQQPPVRRGRAGFAGAILGSWEGGGAMGAR